MATKDVGKITSEKAKELGVKFVMPMVTSLSMGDRSPLIPVAVLDKLLKYGHEFVAYGHYNVPLNREANDFIPDPDTFIQLPWNPEVAWMQCDMYDNGAACTQCPRFKLIELQGKAKQKGFFMMTGFEPEFVLLEKDKHKVIDSLNTMDFKVDHHPHETLRRMDFISELVESMSKLGWGPYKFEHEAIRGQYEVNYDFSDAQTAADRQTFFKFMAKELAIKHDCRLSFMPYPFTNMKLGNGLHINISLWDVDKNNNIFPDSKTDTGLSEIAQHFIAGILGHAQALVAILCPTDNSYRRLHGHFLAEIMGNQTVSWGIGTRFPLIRILPKCDRIELRFADGATNPYLSQAAILAAGLHGIDNKTPLDNSNRLQEDPLAGKVASLATMKTMPKSLQEACAHLQQDNVLKQYLGEDIIDAYLFVKDSQIAETLKVVPDHEISLVDEY